MIGFDTNLVVRLLVEDDVVQARRARRLLEDTAEVGGGYIPDFPRKIA